MSAQSDHKCAAEFGRTGADQSGTWADGAPEISAAGRGVRAIYEAFEAPSSARIDFQRRRKMIISVSGCRGYRCLRALHWATLEATLEI